jgi:hypothetical protein
MQHDAPARLGDGHNNDLRLPCRQMVMIQRDSPKVDAVVSAVRMRAERTYRLRNLPAEVTTFVGRELRKRLTIMCR